MIADCGEMGTRGVRANYEKLAARYDEDRARWSLPPDDIVEELLVSRPSVQVLDLGCGTGRWLAAQRDHVADSTASLVGVDPSSAMLGEARAKCLFRIARAHAEDLPFRDAAFDYIVSNYAFHHFSDKDRALDEVGRVLTLGGVFRINNIEPAAAEGWWLYDFFPEAVAIDAARFWPVPRLSQALAARAFAVDIERESSTEEVPASEALADAERRVVSQLALLDDGAYERGLHRLRKVAATRYATVTSTHSSLRLTARRSHHGDGSAVSDSSIQSSVEA